MTEEEESQMPVEPVTPPVAETVPIEPQVASDEAETNEPTQTACILNLAGVTDVRVH